MQEGTADLMTDLLLDSLDALEAYVCAQGRMRDDWAEGDELVKQSLWRALHECEHEARLVLERAGRGY